MRIGKSSLFFVLYVACAASFVWLTGLGMPVLVASHFRAAGVADGFMPRGVYIGFMVGFVIGLPTAMVLLTRHAMGRSNARINLPNRDYWLAPHRRAETVAVLQTGVLWFGVLLITFLCYVHWLVVRANATQPVHLAETWFFGGLVAFIIALLAWLMVLLGRFRRR